MGEKNILQDFVTIFTPVAEPGEPHQFFFLYCVIYPQRYIIAKFDDSTTKKSVVPICTNEKCKLIQEHVYTS